MKGRQGFDVPGVARRIRDSGVAHLLEEMKELDRLLAPASPHLRRALSEGGHLFPVHQRQMGLCREVAGAVEAGSDGAAAEDLARWIYLRVKDIDAWLRGSPLRLAEALFRSDFWLGVQLDLRGRGFGRMPPPRTDEADFNENYQADRRAITRYAGLLAQMQATVKKMILATHAAADQLSSLEFDPFENLGPLSPLKGHHKTLRLAYEALFSQVAMRDAEALVEAVAVPVAEAAANGLRFRIEDDGFVDDFLAAAGGWLTRRPSLQAVLDHAERELRSRARGTQFLEDRRAIESLLAEVQAAARAAGTPGPTPDGPLDAAALQQARLDVLDASKDRPRAPVLTLYCGLVGLARPDLLTGELR